MTENNHNESNNERGRIKVSHINLPILGDQCGHF